MKYIKLIVLLAIATSLTWAAPTPTPSVVTWELDCFVPDVVKPIQMTIGDDTEATTFWYLRVLLTNDTRDDLDFIPNVDLATNTGEIHPESKDVPVSVYTAIKGLYDQPLLMDLTTAAGKFLQGDDNAKSIVVMFSDFDTDAGQVSIYLEGLSGETSTVTLPSPITRTYIGIDGEGMG